MQGLIWGLVVVAALLLILFIAQYNSIVKLRQFIKNSWSDVDVYLKRRAELIPNLVASVKAYASHEQTVLTAVTEARAHATSLSGPSLDKAAAESQLANGLVQVLMVAEKYPDLKASGNFLDLQKELTETERLNASARQYYNACVRDFNTKLEAFPSNVVAGMMGLKHADFFETESIEERIAPRM